MEICFFVAEECLEIALILMLLLVPQKKWDCERLNTTLEKVSKPSFEVRRQKSVVSQLLSASVSSHHINPVRQVGHL